MRFVIRRNAAGQFWWRMVSSNNRILAVSEMLDSKQACLAAIEVAQREAAVADVVDKTHEITERGSRLSYGPTVRDDE